MTAPFSTLQKPRCVLAFAVIFAIGVWLRVLPGPSFQGRGADEHFYETYVRLLEKTGPLSYPVLFDSYIEYQSDAANMLMLPPGRVTFIAASWALYHFMGLDAHDAVTAVSCAGSVLLLLVCGLFAWRTGGAAFGVAVLALVATAPLEIQISHLALIDSFFGSLATLTVWAQWEVFRNPRSRGWVATYVLALALLVLTKENAAFVAMALGCLLLANLALRFGNNSREIWVATIVGPILGAAALVILAGGISEVVAAYRLNVERSLVSPYAIQTGDGPWHRYLLELLTISPVLFLLFVGGVSRLRAQRDAGWFLLIFFAISYAVMAMVCMNLRYATIWHLPIAWFAVLAIWEFTSSLSAPRQAIARAGAILVVTASQLALFHQVFVAHNVYDPTPEAVQSALFILKESR